MQKLITTICFILIAYVINAQSGANDPSFNPGSGANSTVLTTTVQPDGKIIIGGFFTSYNSATMNYIARLNNDGSIDAGFNSGTGANNAIFATPLQSDGKIIVVGNLSTYNGTPRNYIARLNTDGSLDTTFNPGTGASNGIRAAAILTGGKIIIGGSFTSYNGRPANRIARLNANGTIDTTFVSGTGANNTILATAVQSDGKIIIGGDFTSYNGVTRNRIARLNSNGSIDTTFNPGTAANVTVFAASIQSDGKIIISGDFTSYNGTARNRIVRLNTNGSLDASFNPGTGANSTIFSTIIQSDGKVIIGGAFTTYNGLGRNRIARLNTTGTNDATFNPGTGANNTIWATSLQSDGKIILGGAFSTYNGTTRNCVARILNCITSTSSFSETACDSYLWYGTTYYASASPTHVLPNMAGCDSTITLNLSIINSSGAIQTVTACDSFSWFGTTYTTSGNPTHIIPNAAGCDSITTLNLTVNNSKTSTQTITACESYTWFGTTYTANATAIHTIPTMGGCDSTITLNLTIAHHTIATQTATACDSYTAPDGIIYTTSGVKTAVIPNHAGCDSTITINLTILNSTSSTQTIVACDSITWFGVTYTASGTPTHVVPNMEGCDSTITLNLAIINSTSAIQTITACDSFSWFGTTYTTSGYPTHIIPNAAGCDSITTLNLTVNHSIASTQTIAACNTYTWFGTTYTASATAIHVIPTMAGCDSTITLNLTIDTVNNSVILTDPTLNASENGATYQWIDCNNAYSIIAGETSQVFMPSANGNYGLIISDGMCTDTSACFQIITVGIASLQSNRFEVYPNPFINELNIKFDGATGLIKIEILNSIGQVVYTGQQSNIAHIQTNRFAPGVYFIKFENGNKFEAIKITKE